MCIYTYTYIHGLFFLLLFDGTIQFDDSIQFDESAEACAEHGRVSAAELRPVKFS